jgi:Cytochrome c oxidase subunit IV
MARTTQPTDVDQNEKPIAARGGLRVETWLFLGLTAFFAIAAVVYGILAPTEPVGIVGLSLTAGLTFIVGTFLLFTSRRLEHARPEDNDDAEIADGAGDVGFFSPGSYWPFFMAFSVAMFAVATAFLLWWLMVIAAGFLFYTIIGLLFEYHRRPAH